MILLDSSILIELFRKKDKEKTIFYSLSQSYSDLCISSITYYEIGVGNRVDGSASKHLRSAHLDYGQYPNLTGSSSFVQASSNGARYFSAWVAPSHLATC